VLDKNELRAEVKVKLPLCLTKNHAMNTSLP